MKCYMARRRKKVHWVRIFLILLAVSFLILWDRLSDGKGRNDVDSIILGGDTAAVYFSPDGGCESAIVHEFDMAKRTIDAAIYTFTSRPIAQALVAAKERGVIIRVIMDKSMLDDKFSKLRYLENHGINVVVHNPPGIMHNKMAIVDSHTVITGSFNWTASAQESNYENVIIIKSSRLAQTYGRYFQWMWDKFNRQK